MANYITIESISGSRKDLIKQDLKQRTNQFVWRIKFSIPLNPATVNNKNIYITTVDNAPLLTNIRYDSVNNYVEIEPLEPYNRNESYLLHVTSNVESRKHKKLKKDITIQFSI